MSGLYVYALTRETPDGALGAGLAGEAIVALDAAGVIALAGRVATTPEIDRTTLEAHDTAVRRLAGLVPGLLPVRFGTVVADQSALAEALAVQAGPLREALALVAGREQMTLRAYGAPPTGTEDSAEPADEDACRGPGARYLAARLRDQRRIEDLPALAPLRAALAPLVHAERLERHATPPLVASVYHLITRGGAGDYRARLDAARPALAPMRIAVSGPWPPYAFAPGLDARTGAVA